MKGMVACSEILMDDISAVCLRASTLALDNRLANWNATFGRGLSLLVDEEDAIKGPLLRALAGEMPPRAGAVSWGGVDMRVRRERMPGAVFWRDPRAPWPDVSPAQWARELARCHPAWSEPDWLRHVGEWALHEHLHKEMFRLSTGSRRKVLLAAAFASGAPLTVIEEPEAALDHASIRYLREALGAEAERCRQNGRVWVVAHYALMPQVPWNQVIRLP